MFQKDPESVGKPASRTARPPRSLDADPTRGTYRAPEDDFFCLRYGVWYPSFDCAVRTRYRTSGGCLDCDQGRFNLKRHAPALTPRELRLLRRAYHG